MGLIDTAELLARVDLERLCADVPLYRVGQELHGPCPFCICGSSRPRHRCDRFRLNRDRTRWYCRHCAPQGGDAIAYVQRRDGVDFATACAVLGGGAVAPPGRGGSPTARAAPPAPEPPPPAV